MGCRITGTLGFLLLVMLGIVRAAFVPLAHGAETQPEPVSAASIVSGPADSAAGVDCRQLIALLQEEKILISREAGQIKRELAALREDLSKPGTREIFAGIGYIFGLAGIGLYAHSRKGRSRG